MYPRDAAFPRPTHPAVTLVLIGVLLPACGRIGVELLPEPLTSDDTSVTLGDAGLDAGAMPPPGVGAPQPGDAGTGAGGAVEACLASCRNGHGSAQCNDRGQCVLVCSAGFADCDGEGGNGCETNLASDPVHCGTCARSCNVNTELCETGTCKLSPCPAGRAECDGDPAQLCETDLTSSAQSCGFCGNTCVVAHGSAACQQRSCVVASCDPGYADCNMNPADGCEASLSSVDHCGMCGRSCPAGDGTPSCNAGACAVTCSMTGTYALKLSIRASWPATIAVSAGSGEFTFWGQLDLNQAGTALSGSFTPCGEVVPDFRAAPLINELYGLVVPNSLFDRSPALPSVAASGALSSLSPGARFTLARTAFMYGASMSDPVAGAWPSAAALGTVDSDTDGKTAISAPYKTGAGYTPPPANNFGTVRAQTCYLATRVVFALDGMLNGCTRASGSASAQDVDSHTLGCRTSSGLRDCSTLEASHLDSNTPNFMPSTGSYQLVKLATPGCAAVRAALP